MHLEGAVELHSLIVTSAADRYKKHEFDETVERLLFAWLFFHRVKVRSHQSILDITDSNKENDRSRWRQQGD